VTLAGQVITGFSVSLTVTLKLQVAVLPEASVAVQVTLFVPFAKVEPLAGLHTLVTPGQLSVALTNQVTLEASQTPAVVFVTMLAGQVITGFSVSLTVTVKLQLAVLPEASVAVQLTVFVPFGKMKPLGGVQTKLTPGQLSDRVGAKGTLAVHRPGPVL